MADGEAKLLKTVDGRTYFAKVHVGATAADTDRVVNRIPAVPDPDAGEIGGALQQEWLAAASRGIRAALAAARRCRNVSSRPGTRVEIQQVIGSVLDTTSDAVEVAAFLALWQALGIQEPRPQVLFLDGVWQVKI